MSADLALEILGYAASVLVIFSLAMRSILRLRVVGLAGALAFAVYGALIGSWPVAGTNLVILGIHAWYLREILGASEYFTTLSVSPDSRYLAFFCEFHLPEIRRFFPGWSLDVSHADRNVFILRDAVPAGLWIAREHGDGSLEIVLDFVIPRYRDFKLGGWVYGRDSEILQGVERARVWSEAGAPAHAAYLERMGFVRSARHGREVFVLAR